MPTLRQAPSLIAVLALGAITAGCLSGSTGPDSAALPVAGMSVYYEAPELGEILLRGDEAIRARLQRISPAHRIVVNSEEDRDVGEEMVGLRFEIVDVLAGDRTVGEEVVVEWNGYIIDAATKERTTELTINGHGLDDWKVGADYLFFVAETEHGAQFSSGELVALVRAKGELAPIISPRSGVAFEGARTVADLQQLVDAVLTQLQD